MRQANGAMNIIDLDCGLVSSTQMQRYNRWYHTAKSRVAIRYKFRRFQSKIYPSGYRLYHIVVTIMAHTYREILVSKTGIQGMH